MKKILAILMIITMVASMVACGEKNGDNKTSGKNKSEKIVLKAGTQPTFPPFDTVDENQNVVGFDMDLIKAIGKDQGFDVEFVNQEFSGLIPAIQSGSIDIVTSGMSITDNRKEQVLFSDPYWQAGLVVAVNSENEKISSVNDFDKTMKIGAQLGTASAGMVQKLQAEGKIGEAVIMDGLDVLMLQLAKGDVSAVINDEPVTKAYISKQKGKIKIVGDIMNAESYGFAVKKNNKELVKKINKGLENVKNSGEFDKLVEKWFK